MSITEIIKRCQRRLGETDDGIPGMRTWTAISRAIGVDLADPVPTDIEHHGKASSFADPKDVEAFKKCKARGKSDNECFKVGDNAVGCWGDSTAEGTGPSCAIPPEDIEAKWGSVEAGRHKLVDVMANGKIVTCVLKDRMPRKSNITNGAIIDLNPDAVRGLGLVPPLMISASWKWVA